MKNFVLIVAAGRGERYNRSIIQTSSDKIIPKQYLKIDNESITQITIKKFLSIFEIDFIQVVINENDLDIYKESIKDIIDNNKLLPVAYGGSSRQESIFLGLKTISKYNPVNVLIHDAVRPMISEEIIKKLIEKLSENKGVIVAKKATDTIKKFENGTITTLDRNNLYLAETPQAFKFQDILNAHIKFKGREFTDDASLFEKLNIPIAIIESNMDNIKITTKEDFAKINNMGNYKNKVGIGFDAHKFSEIIEDKNNQITLGGIKIPFDREIIAHSDGDVILHAIVDAMLGAISAGDIGMHFSPSDDRWKDADSSLFVEHSLNLMNAKNATINNIDVIVISEKPKIGNYREAIRANIAKLLKIEIDCVSVKATTTDKMGFTGRGEGLAAQAIISINAL